MLHLVKKIIFTSRTCVEEWKLVVVYHLHGYLPLILWCIISLRNHIYHLHKGIPVTEKRPQKPEIGIKDGFEEMEKKFPYGTFWDRQYLVASKVFFY